MKSKILILLFALAAFTFSCKKESTTDTDTSAAEDHAYAENTFNDVSSIEDESIRETPGMYNKTEEVTAILTGCAVITVDTSGSPRKMTIDFGTGCTGNDGRIRTGKIIITFTGRYHQTGTVITTTFDNYTVNGNKVEGTKTVTNMGTNSKGNIEFKVVVKDAKITTSSGVISWNSTRTREWTAGANTLTVMDDEYSITGSAEGTNRNNVHFKADITSPLKVKIGCKWIVAGTLTITPDNKATRTIDYGSGTCDDVATVTINSKSYTVHLR